MGGERGERRGAGVVRRNQSIPIMLERRGNGPNGSRVEERRGEGRGWKNE